MLPWFSPGLSQNVRNFGQNKAAPGMPNTAGCQSSRVLVLPAAVAPVAELVVEVLPDVADFCLNDSHLLPPFVVLLRNQPQRFLMALDC